MNDSFFALSLIGLFLIFYLGLRSFYVRSEMQKIVTELDKEAEREEFPDFISVEEDFVTGKNHPFNFRHQTDFTSDTGKHNF